MLEQRGDALVAELAGEAESRQALLKQSLTVDPQPFEIARPSLHDIFVRIAGPEAGQAIAESQTVAGAAD